MGRDSQIPVEAQERLREHGQYEGSTLNTDFRLGYYDCAEDPTPLNEAALNTLLEQKRLNPDAVVADVGCSKVTSARHLRQVIGHRGPYIGVDLYENSFPSVLPLLKSGELPDVNCVVGSAHELPLNYESVDIVMFIRLMHHIQPDDQEQVVREGTRVLKPGGIAIFGTSGEFNRAVHHKLEDQIAKALGVEPPDRINQNFDSNRAVEFLGNLLVGTLEKYHHTSKSIKVRRDRIDRLLDSLISMHTDFRPIPDGRQFRRFIREVIGRQVLAEIDSEGFMYDYDDRVFFFWQKPA